MQSFRSEIESSIVERDIIDLEKKINQYYSGKLDESSFRSLRLARGVYGQRQFGVQMIRMKLPYGKLTSEQLLRIAKVSDDYSRGRLHITTRQDIQIHHVSLDRTPELWAELEKDDITLREACGNAVRNITASEMAGIDPTEPFDVSPYAHAVFKFFLRNPICQEMGRKFKISFSATDKDEALSFMHDLGFIAKADEDKCGFKVMLGGGLGSQPRLADVLFEFIETNQIIPLIEATLRVFDRYGERVKRARARLKFLINELGKEAFLDLIKQEKKALAYQSFEIDTSDFEKEISIPEIHIPNVNGIDKTQYELWRSTNVFPQKQKGLFAIGIKIPLGNFYTDKARKLAQLIKNYAGNELRLTLHQNILIRHVKTALLPFFYQELNKLSFAEAGYRSTFDITSCPGTDTCNLGIASSTGIAQKLEKVLKEEYPQYVNRKDIIIKISGCTNACGQHVLAQIGFQGMSLKVKNYTVPALQVLLGGDNLGNGQARIADKVIKIPSKRGSQALRLLLNDFESNKINEELFLDYYLRQVENYFYNLLKPLAKTDNLKEKDFVDWGSDQLYERAIGTGECAGVVIDLVATLLLDSQEKIDNALGAVKQNQLADGIYYAYTSFVNTAKALLLSENEKTNTQAGIIANFDKIFKDKFSFKSSFLELVYQIKYQKPSKEFAEKYIEEAQVFLNQANKQNNKITQDVL